MSRTRMFNEIEVWEESVDGNVIAWVAYWRPLDLHSQGRTKEEAVEAVKEAIVGWVSVMNQPGSRRWRVQHSADRNYRTGIHIRSPDDVAQAVSTRKIVDSQDLADQDTKAFLDAHSSADKDRRIEGLRAELEQVISTMPSDSRLVTRLRACLAADKELT